MRTLKRTITLEVEISYKITPTSIVSDRYGFDANEYQIVKIATPELENICKEIIENEEGFND